MGIFEDTSSNKFFLVLICFQKFIYFSDGEILSKIYKYIVSKNSMPLSEILFSLLVSLVTSDNKLIFYFQFAFSLLDKNFFEKFLNYRKRFLIIQARNVKTYSFYLTFFIRCSLI